jgi:hypothetical protein
MAAPALLRHTYIAYLDACIRNQLVLCKRICLLSRQNCESHVLHVQYQAIYNMLRAHDTPFIIELLQLLNGQW